MAMDKCALIGHCLGVSHTLVTNYYIGWL